MATNKAHIGDPRLWVLCLLAAAAPALSREAASVSECQAAGAQPGIAEARAKAVRAPDDLRAQFALADAWSDAGCFTDALNALQATAHAHPDSSELQTRLRVARSLVGEEHFFEDLDRADAQAKLKRTSFRCTTLSDLEACADAVRMKPDDPTLLVAQGDALMHAQRPAEAVVRYRRAASLTLDSQGVSAKLHAAESAIAAPLAEAHSVDKVQTAETKNLHVVRLNPRSPPARRYSNTAQDSQSH